MEPELKEFSFHPASTADSGILLILLILSKKVFTRPLANLALGADFYFALFRSPP
jgi:hypothetical protein